MRITFDIPDTVKAFHGCIVYDKGTTNFDLQMCTWDMLTDGIQDGMCVVLPPSRLDKNQILEQGDKNYE